MKFGVPLSAVAWRVAVALLLAERRSLNGTPSCARHAGAHEPKRRAPSETRRSVKRRGVAGCSSVVTCIQKRAEDLRNDPSKANAQLMPIAGVRLGIAIFKSDTFARLAMSNR